MRYVIVVLAGLIVAGCTTAPVYLKHKETGEVVTCGPFRASGMSAAAGALRESQCIQDYQRQGYERAP